MGYHTDFTGKFEFNKPLALEHKNYLTQFAQTRRMKRDAVKTATMKDPVRMAAGLSIGHVDAEYFVGGTGEMGQGSDDSILEYNDPPETQPGLWCQWVPSEDGKYLQWDGSEKFYDYVVWLRYIVVNFLERWGYTITGIVGWQGEEPDDKGRIIAKDNKLEVVKLP